MKGFNWKKITKQSEFYVFLIIVVLSVIIQIRSGLFFANNNIVDIMRSMIVPCIYALCAFLAFISTGPDVSFPLIAALSSYLAITITYKTGYDGPWIVVFIIGMFFGALMGAFNGFIIVKYKFSSLIVTLGTSSIFSGLLLGAFEAERMDLPDTLQRFGKVSLLTVKNAKTGLGSTLPMTFERWCGNSERMYPRYLTSYHGIKQSDPSRNLCLLAESIYRCDHYHWYCNFRNAEP